MSTSFVSLLPFLAALQRQQGVFPDDDDGNAPGFMPAPPQPGQNLPGPGTPAPWLQQDQSQQDPSQQNNGPLLMQLLQSGIYPSPPTPGGPGTPQSGDPNQARTASDQGMAAGSAAASGSGAGAPQSGAAGGQSSDLAAARAADTEAALQRGRQRQQQQVSDADRAAGNVIRVGQRPLLPDAADRWYHTYIEIPRIVNGKFTGEYDSYGVLGEYDKNGQGTPHNQQVLPNDDRNTPKPGSNRNAIYEISVTPEQLAALRSGAEHWSQWQDTGDPCPSCGKKYVRGGPLSARPAYNSNTWVYNMLIHNPAGRIEPPAAINNKEAPGWSVNDVSRDYYATSGVQ